MYVATDQGRASAGKSTLQRGAPDLPIQPAPRCPTQPEPAKCPRCASTNTKFCYYNNYNKSQPRHFCKSCKRHWTKGGTLRNVPVGGARTKNKRPKIPKSATKPATASGEQKGMSSILYRALIGGPPLPRGQTDNGLNTTTDEQFQFSSLSAFEIMTPPLNPIEYRYNLDPTEDSSKNYNDNSKVNIPGSSNGLWPGPDTTVSCFDLLPNYWNWSEIEVMASSDDHHLNIPWDEVKP